MQGSGGWGCGRAEKLWALLKLSQALKLAALPVSLRPSQTEELRSKTSANGKPKTTPVRRARWQRHVGHKQRLNLTEFPRALITASKINHSADWSTEWAVTTSKGHRHLWGGGLRWNFVFWPLLSVP